MPLQDGIRKFLDGVDSKILARGQDYYRAGRVESIEWDGCHATAEVSGSDVEPYWTIVNQSGQAKMLKKEFQPDWEVGRDYGNGVCGSCRSLRYRMAGSA